MRPVTYEIEYKSGFGVISEDGSWVYPLASLDMDYKTMQELIGSVSGSGKQLLEYVFGQSPYEIRGATLIGEVSLLAPVPHPRQDTTCLRVNYTTYAGGSARLKKEAFDEERPRAIYFSRWVDRTTDSGAGIPSYKDTATDLNYEAELAVIISREVLHVREEDVKDCISRYTIVNDVSARTLQTRYKQWYFDERLDGFPPMRPCIVTVDELSYPPKVRVQSGISGELRQDSNTELLIFNTSHVASELSQGMTSKPGTIIVAGTPAKMGMGSDPPKLLVPGDMVECTIKGIDTIANKVTD